MLQARSGLAYTLSILIAVLAAAASAGGLFADDLYRDNALITAAFRGNDLVTLVIAVPLLLVAMFLARRGSQRAHLVWLGILGYMLYNYVFYLYGAAFNRFFLVYAALCPLSIFALVLGLSNADVAGISRMFNPRTPVRWISGFMLFFVLLLGGMWIARSLSFVASGQVPQDIVQTGHPTGVVYATDLSLLMPGLVLGAILLRKRQPWGCVLGTVMMIKASTYGLALIVMTVFAGNIGSDPLLPLWVFLTTGCLLSLGFLLGNMQPARHPAVVNRGRTP